jgi:hypothetical protein
MTRCIVVCSCLLILCFAAIIVLIQAQLYDDGQLRAFLLPPEDCPIPCFMGIRPGVTTVDEAVAILETHQWVESLHVLEATDGRGVYAIAAEWSSIPRDLIDNSENLWMGVEDEIIQRIVVYTRIPLGDIVLSLGSPQFGGIYDDGVVAAYFGTYLDLSASFSGGQSCPIRSIWRLQTVWVLGDIAFPLDSASADTLPNQVYAACRRLLSGQ